jgi:hypothetical protein
MDNGGTTIDKMRIRQPAPKSRDVYVHAASCPESSLIDRLQDAQLKIQGWISRYARATAHHARTVASLSVPNLSRCYPIELLESTRVVLCDEIRYPPLDEFGLEEFKPMNAIPWSGITYNDIYFLRRDVACPALHFHELVHVVQYGCLGIERFLRAYGVGLALHGYEDSPLEKMAYDLQLEYEHGIYRRSLVADIERRTDAVWRETYSQANNLAGSPRSL